jgi:chromate transporter
MSSSSSVGATTPSAAQVVRVPKESLARLFLRFLHFGILAWGGPIAQIAMLRRAFVEEERWVTSEQFNRILALYQVLPGPEAHEMCVYFGMLARGRLGGLLAGLGFMLPGFVLMFALSWAYVSLGLDLRGDFALLFAAVQAAVVALIVRAVHRIGGHVLSDVLLWIIAIAAAGGQFAGVHFVALLVGGGLVYVAGKRSPLFAVVAIAIGTIATLTWYFSRPLTHEVLVADSELAIGAASVAALFWSGLKAGSLTFGGAYTVIPFLQRDAVTRGGWMTNAHFMDGIALAGLLPAPLVIFATFVGYVAGGPLGAIVMTVGVFLPAFAFTLIAHDPLERLVHDPRVKTFLEGVTAGVVGIIAATALGLMVVSLQSTTSVLVFAVSLTALFVWNHRFLVPIIVAFAIAFGLVATAVSNSL